MLRQVSDAEDYAVHTLQGNSALTKNMYMSPAEYRERIAETACRLKDVSTMGRMQLNESHARSKVNSDVMSEAIRGAGFNYSMRASFIHKILIYNRYFHGIASLGSLNYA